MARDIRNGARLFPNRNIVQPGNMIGRGAAAPTENIQKSSFEKFINDGGHFFRRLIIFAKFIGQTRIRVDADMGVGNPRHFGDIGAHIRGAERTI